MQSRLQTTWETATDDDGFRLLLGLLPPAWDGAEAMQIIILHRTVVGRPFSGDVWQLHFLMLLDRPCLLVEQ